MERKSGFISGERSVWRLQKRKQHIQAYTAIKQKHR